VSATQVPSRPRRVATQLEARLVDARRHGDPAERAALIEEFMPLAQALGWRFWRSNDAHDDLGRAAATRWTPPH
jgi:hypothetical protein